MYVKGHVFKLVLQHVNLHASIIVNGNAARTADLVVPKDVRTDVQVAHHVLGIALVLLK